MQESQNKDRDKIMSSASPSTSLKNTTTVTVVCNGVRSSSSSLSSLSDTALDDCHQNSHPKMKTNSGVFVSSVTVGDAGRKGTPPAAPRKKQGSSNLTTPSPMSSAKSSPASSLKSSPTASLRSSPVPSIKSPIFAADMHPSSSMPLLKPSDGTYSPRPSKTPPPVLPRVNSKGMNAEVTVNAKGHQSSSDPAGDDSGSDFLASLPSLPSDEHVALSLSSYSNKWTSPAEDLQDLSKSPTVIGTTATTPSSKTALDADGSAQRKPPPPPPPPKSIPPAPPLPPVKAPPPPPPSKPVRPPAPQVSRKLEKSQPPPAGVTENGTLPEEEEEEDDPASGAYPREKFYVNMKNGGAASTEAGGGGGQTTTTTTTFAGRRDVTDPQTLREKRIVSSKGTVRGFKNRVRAGIVTFVDPSSGKFNYRELEKGKIVLYTTSMMVVRETAERCKACRNILQNHMVRFHQQDLYMNPDHQRTLRQRLDMPATAALDLVPLPQVFIDGIHLGGVGDLEKLNETGELRKLLQSFPKIQVRTMCDTCGGYRYVLCSMCHGSKRSVHRNNFTEEFFALRCMHCDDNGLQRCSDCMDQQE